MATAKTREQLEADWWQDWWAADYSWDGLLDPKKNIAGDGGLHGAVSRQDYWRIDPATGHPRSDADMGEAGEFEIAPNGRLWHIAFVPMVWPDGSAAKSDWDDEKRAHLAAIVAARIAAAKETQVTQKIFEGEIVTGIDGRAQLQGSILLDPPAHPAGVEELIHITATRCRLPAWDARKHNFGPGARFYSATFTGDASFENATFTGDASFSRATFAGIAGFDSATFTGHARFYSATFTDDARFDSATFTGDARFDSATLKGDASFNRATFAGIAGFDSAKFEKSSFFQKARFKFQDGDTERSGQMRFHKAVFAGPVDFDRAVFATSPAHHSAGFLGARFADLASFRRCGDHWVAALDEAEIKGRILIDERDEADSLHDFDTLVLPRARDGFDNPLTWEPLLKELEGGCRTIKVAMGAARNEIMEQRYYRFQLLARREQAGVPLSERLVSHLFGWAADYGLSLTRPLAGLGILLLVFTIVYANFWHATGEFGNAGLIKSIEMAASRMFPFGAFEFVSRDWFNQLACRGAYPYTLLFARLFASLQSLIALLLIFLFGLAVRRRFKVGE